MGIGVSFKHENEIRKKVQHLAFSLGCKEIEWNMWEIEFIKSVNEKESARFSVKQLEWINKMHSRILRKGGLTKKVISTEVDKLTAPCQLFK